MMEYSGRECGGTYDTLETLEMIDRTEGPNERALHGESAS